MSSYFDGILRPLYFQYLMRVNANGSKATTTLLLSAIPILLSFLVGCALRGTFGSCINLRYPSFFAVFIENDDKEVAYLTFGGTGSYKKAK